MKRTKKKTSKIGKFFDKKIILPITRFIINISKIFNKLSKRIEKWLSSANTLLFVSLFLAIVVFIMIDQKILILTENSAEVLKSQPVNVIYNEESSASKLYGEIIKENN